VKILKTVTLAIALICCCFFANAQGTTSMGTEFWTAYMDNTNPPGTAQGSEMFLYITSNVNTSGNVAIVDGSFTQTFTLLANQVTTVQIPASAFLNAQGSFNKGIHITSLNPIAIYAHIFAQESSGATLLLPVNAMGKDYYSINYTQSANETAYSAFLVIATQDSTTIQITSPTGAFSTVSLNKGEVYQQLSPKDLTGTRIQSISSGANTCKKIAVFSGSSRIAIGCPNNSSDNLFQQVYPTATWGKDYITVPLKNRDYDVFRVILSNPNTNLLINGQLIAKTQYQNPMYYEFDSSVPNVITADQPIQAVQYAVTQGNTVNCVNDGNDIGDPEMIFLTPLEQTLDHVTLYSTSNFDILQSYINVLIKTAAVASFELDGASYTTFKPVPGDNTYSYAQINVGNGAHNLSADDGFNAIAYGFGFAESYGYAAGANLQNLSEYISFQNPQTDSLQKNGCTGVNYNLQLTLPYKTTGISWDFKNGSAPYQQNNPVIAGTKQNGTQTLYLYDYPKDPVSFKKGNYTILATVVDPGADACGSTDQVEFDYNISDPPIAKFNVDNTYVGSATAFVDQTVSDTSIKTWAWNFGDQQTSGLQNPVHTYASPGNYTVTLTVTDVDGCTSTYQKIIDVAIVVSPVTGSIGACEGTASASPNIQQFTVSGGTLTANIIVTAPPDFEVSLNANSGYGNSVTINETGGMVNKVPVYVRSVATAPIGNIMGNIKLTSTGSSSISLAVNGIVNVVPMVNPVGPQIVANGTNTQAINFTGASSGFNWINDTPSIGLAASGTGNIPAFTAINNNGTSPVTATISVVPVSIPLAYIANSGSNTVSVINILNNTVVSTINVDGYPLGVAASADGSSVYVTDYQNGSISVISIATNTVEAIIKVGSNPFGIAVSPDGSKIYVANTFSNTISVINASTNTTLPAITVGLNPTGVAVSADGSKVYVANSGTNTVSVVSTSTNAVSQTITVGSGPNGVILSADGTKLYVTNSNSNTVSVIDVASNQVTFTIQVGTDPLGMSTSSDGKMIYVANSKSNSVSVINAATNNLITTIPVQNAPFGLSVSPDGSELYVANQHSNSVSVINTSTNIVSATLQTGTGPSSFGNFITGGKGCNGTPVNFTITVKPTLPATITTTGNLAALNTTYGTPSSSTSLLVSGTNIVTGIAITAPNGFELSTDGINFTNTVTISGIGIISPTKIYIRLAATTPVCSCYSGNILLSTTNTANVNVAMPLSTVDPAPLTIKADDKTRIYNTVNPVLTVTYTGFVNNENSTQLIMQPQITTTAVTTSPVGTYPITASSATAANYSFIYIPGTLTVAPAISMISIPNTFTPNGDGINDVWDIKYLQYYPRCTVNIYNRWGQKLFSSVGYPIPWDGKYNGTYLPTGTYYYIIDTKTNDKVIAGYVAIIR
jgi:gliding motility-associated-like protein